MALRVEVVSPEQVLWTGEASMVVARTAGGGEIGFLPGHAPFIGALDVAAVRVIQEGGDEAIAVHGGFVEVSHDKLTVLSDMAELASQIDVARAEAARADAEARLKRVPGDPDAARDLRKADVRLQVAGATRTAAH